MCFTLMGSLETTLSGSANNSKCLKTTCGFFHHDLPHMSTQFLGFTLYIILRKTFFMLLGEKSWTYMFLIGQRRYVKTILHVFLLHLPRDV